MPRGVSSVSVRGSSSPAISRQPRGAWLSPVKGQCSSRCLSCTRGTLAPERDFAHTVSSHSHPSPANPTSIYQMRNPSQESEVAALSKSSDSSWAEARGCYSILCRQRQEDPKFELILNNLVSLRSYWTQLEFNMNE